MSNEMKYHIYSTSMRTNLHSLVIGNFLILGRKPSVCLDNHCFIGSHPNSKNKADFGIFILVSRINLATLYCHDAKDAILALEDGIQTAQPWGIDGRIMISINHHQKKFMFTLQFYYIIILFLKIFLEITVYMVDKIQRSDHQMKINVIERISNRKYTKGHRNNLLILECDWMKHFILKT